MNSISLGDIFVELFETFDLEDMKYLTTDDFLQLCNLIGLT